MVFECAIEIEIPDDIWEEVGSDEDLRSRLYCSFLIGGVYHHVEAIAVKMEGHYQKAVDSEFDGVLDGMYEISTPDKPFQTITIRGREYVLTMTPFC